MMKKLSLLLVTTALAALLLVSGCGQTGPLYLPDDTAKTTKS
jgi:predicted small lipoprotein YifL